VIFKNIRVVWEDTRPLVLARHPEWVIDAVLGPLLDPAEAVVVTGFWRSGTTWLLEALSKMLAAKSVFEPLKPDVTGYSEYPSRHYRGGEAAIDGFMPFCTDALEDCPRLRRHLLRCLTGAAPGVFVRAARFNVRSTENRASTWAPAQLKHRVSDALRRQVVTKFTRAHLLLPLLQSEFSPPVFHIRRDPRAVIESLQRQGWSGWMRAMSLEDYLLSPDDGRSDVFSRWSDEIRRCDRDGYLARVAGYWALAEWYVDQMAENRLVEVSFEALCREDGDQLKTLSDETGVEDSRVQRALHGESRTSDHVKTAEQRISGWKNRLDPREASKIEEVIRRFGMEAYLL